MLDDCPAVFPGNGWIYRAYLALETCRAVGMALGPIPFTACMEYARVALDLDDEGALFLWDIVHRVDRAVRAHTAKKQKR